MRSVVVLLFVAASVLVLPSPAFACSCAERDPVSALRDGDAAVVVTATESSTRGAMALGTHAVDVVVERVLRGELGIGPLEISTRGLGASCGFELPRGRTTGVILDRDGGRWWAGLCDQLSPGPLLAAAEDLPLANGGEPTLVAAGRFGHAGLVVLDAGGRALGWGDSVGYVHALAACPGGRHVAEVAMEESGTVRVVVRRTEDLESVRSVALPDVASEHLRASLACADPEAERIVVGTLHDSGAGRGRGLVHAVRDDAAELLLDTARRRFPGVDPGAVVDAVAVTREVAYLSFASDGDEWRDRRSTLVAAALDGSGSTSLDLGRLSVDTALPSPDGERLAMTAYSHEEGVGMVLVTVERAPSLRVLARAEAPGGAATRAVLWLDDEVLVVRTPETEEPDYLADVDLHQLGELPATPGWEAVAVGDALYTAGGATMRAVKFVGEEARTVGPLHLASATDLVSLSAARVPRDLEATGPLPAPSPLPVPTILTDVPLPLVIGILALAILLAAAASWLVWRGVRLLRPRREG